MIQLIMISAKRLMLFAFKTIKTEVDYNKGARLLWEMWVMHALRQDVVVLAPTILGSSPTERAILEL